MIFTYRVRHWLPLLPLLALVGVVYWLQQQTLPLSVPSGSKLRHEPDAIVDNFSAVTLDEQGAPRFILAAKSMLHYPDDDSTALEVPRITMYSPERSPMHAVAQHGTISRRGDEVTLFGDVEVLREAGKQQSELTLQTEYLHVVPEQDKADSNRAITVTDAHSTLRAVGLELDNKARTLKLLSQVRSEHVPVRE